MVTFAFPQRNHFADDKAFRFLSMRRSASSVYYPQLFVANFALPCYSISISRRKCVKRWYVASCLQRCRRWTGRLCTRFVVTFVVFVTLSRNNFMTDDRKWRLDCQLLLSTNSIAVRSNINSKAIQAPADTAANSSDRSTYICTITTTTTTATNYRGERSNWDCVVMAVMLFLLLLLLFMLLGAQFI